MCTLDLPTLSIYIHQTNRSAKLQLLTMTCSFCKTNDDVIIATSILYKINYCIVLSCISYRTSTVVVRKNNLTIFIVFTYTSKLFTDQFLFHFQTKDRNGCVYLWSSISGQVTETSKTTTFNPFLLLHVFVLVSKPIHQYTVTFLLGSFKPVSFIACFHINKLICHCNFFLMENFILYGRCCVYRMRLLEHALFCSINNCNWLTLVYVPLSNNNYIVYITLQYSLWDSISHNFSHLVTRLWSTLLQGVTIPFLCVGTYVLN